MRKIIFYLAVAFAIIGFASCSSDDDGSGGSSTVGVNFTGEWRVDSMLDGDAVRFTYYPESRFTITFNENGSCATSGEAEAYYYPFSDSKKSSIGGWMLENLQEASTWSSVYNTYYNEQAINIGSYSYNVHISSKNSSVVELWRKGTTPIYYLHKIE